MKRIKNEIGGSADLIVLGLIAALIIVLAVPLLSSFGSSDSDVVVNSVESEKPAVHHVGQ